MNDYTKTVTEQLANIIREMQRIGLWQTTPPAQTAFSSEEPFAIDTMEPAEWLQWVFIPRMQALIDAGKELPRNYSLHPYFEEAFDEQPEALTLLNLLKQLDTLSCLAD